MSAAPADPVAIEQWDRLLDALGEVGRHVVGGPQAQTVLAQGQAVRYMLRILRGMFLTAIEVDNPDYPTLVRLFGPDLPYPNSNPDCIYLHGAVSPAHTYRISGYRGTSRLVEIQIMDGHFLAGPNHKSLTTLADLDADTDGKLEIILSAKPQPGNWVKLDPGAAWFYLRQYFYDWEKESPADLAIERLGAEYPPPLPSSAEIARRVDCLIDWVPTWYRHLEQRAGAYYESPADRCAFLGSPSGMDGLLYGRGYFNLADGQAAILEFRPPECRYWSIQVMNSFWETQEFDWRQTSLNGHQAVLDPDGVFRGVISVTDPGVPNWLDPVGHGRGLICARVLYSEVMPEVAIKIVSLERLYEDLHPDTPQVSISERSESLRRRMQAVRRLFRE